MPESWINPIIIALSIGAFLMFVWFAWDEHKKNAQRNHNHYK